MSHVQLILLQTSFITSAGGQILLIIALIATDLCTQYIYVELQDEWKGPYFFLKSQQMGKKQQLAAFYFVNSIAAFLFNQYAFTA